MGVERRHIYEDKQRIKSKEGEKGCALCVLMHVSVFDKVRKGEVERYGFGGQKCVVVV